MAYKVDKFNGTFLTSVADGTIDTTTDLRFVGKNYAGYGEIQNENFLHLMENFANISPPPKAITGQLWYDATATEKRLKFYDGNNWRVAGGAQSSVVAPAGLQTGEFWWDSIAKQLYAWSGTEFVLVGPEAAPDLGAAAVTSRVVYDNTIPTPVPYTIVEIKANGVTVAIISNATFTLGGQNPIVNFSLIKKGITLVDTSVSGISNSDYRYWGTSSNSDKLGGRNAADFIALLEGDFSQTVRFGDNGFTLGDRINFEIKVENTDRLILENKLGENITLRIAPNDIVYFETDGIIPGSDDIYNLGRSNVRWKNLYAIDVRATTLRGDLIGTSTGTHRGNVLAANNGIIVNAATNTVGNPDKSTLIIGQFDGTFIGNLTGQATSAVNVGGFTPSVAATPNTIPVRNSSSDIFARNFVASGSVNRADTLAFAGDFYTASATVPSGGRSIVARDQSGDIYANLFQGTATSARYADLAEKYIPDQSYTVGTVVAVGGIAEITAANINEKAIGVISENPAFRMNSDLESGIYVALKGRVPVKVIGKVKKGDRLMSYSSGVASVATQDQYHNVFGIALETNEIEDVKLIESVIL
jgi:hypothetical protein